MCVAGVAHRLAEHCDGAAQSADSGAHQQVLQIAALAQQSVRDESRVLRRVGGARTGALHPRRRARHRLSARVLSHLGRLRVQGNTQEREEKRRILTFLFFFFVCRATLM
jgi:hypothetical protein